MKIQKIYLRFLELTNLLEQSSSLPLLEPIEKRILEIIAKANFKNERLSVKDMMAKSEIAAPATIHKNIHLLVKKRWIYLEDTEDARRKQLQITSEGMRYFAKLGVAVQKSIK